MNKYILITFLIASVGCTSPLVATSEATEVILLTPTPIFTVAPTLTKEATSTAVSVTNATAFPIWTALPTISSDAGLQTLYKWMEGGAECLLPCWAGITPGQTVWDEASYLIEPISGFAKLKYFFNESCAFGECNEISWSLPSPGDAHGYIYSQLPENKIHAVIVELTDPSLLEALGLKNVLNSYGKPAILLFSTDPDQPGQKHLELILVYPERQFLIRYSRYAEISGENIESCGQDSVIKLVILDNQEQLASVDVIAKSIETKEFRVNVWHKSVEESTGMTIDAFYDAFSKDNEPCIVTPIMLWQP